MVPGERTVDKYPKMTLEIRNIENAYVEENLGNGSVDCDMYGKYGCREITYCECGCRNDPKIWLTY